MAEVDNEKCFTLIQTFPFKKGIFSSVITFVENKGLGLSFGFYRGISEILMPTINKIFSRPGGNNLFHPKYYPVDGETGIDSIS